MGNIFTFTGGAEGPELATQDRPHPGDGNALGFQGLDLLVECRALLATLTVQRPGLAGPELACGVRRPVLLLA